MAGRAAQVAFDLSTTGKHCLCLFSPFAALPYSHTNLNDRLELFRAGLIVGGEETAEGPGCSLTPLGREVLALL